MGSWVSRNPIFKLTAETADYRYQHNLQIKWIQARELCNRKLTLSTENRIIFIYSLKSLLFSNRAVSCKLNYSNRTSIVVCNPLRNPLLKNSGCATGQCYSTRKTRVIFITNLTIQPFPIGTKYDLSSTIKVPVFCR